MTDHDYDCYAHYNYDTDQDYRLLPLLLAL